MTSSASHTQREIEAWLTTMHAASGVRGTYSAATIRPRDLSVQPLLKAFAQIEAGSSAAPITIGATLAEGGMGVVKLAEQRALGRTVVIKTLRGDHAKSAAEHVLREAWATGALEHPNIVPVHDIRVDDHGVPVIVLKRIEGDSWSALMHDTAELHKRFAVSDALDWNLDILRQVCQAVRFAHSRGILHRDLKPDNVMIGAFGEVYLVDWGIALSLREDLDCPLALARDQCEMAGTPCYLAPEMLGEHPLDARTDIYLLGGLLFEILAGTPPHRTTNLSTLLGDIRRSEPQVPGDAPSGLASICRQAMSARPDDRFADASAFALALQNYSQTRGSQRLADQARTQVESLLSCLTVPDVDVQEAYRYFGALRFGYESALAAWPENLRAQSELDEARVQMIEFELDRGNIEAAAGLLQALEDVPVELRKRVLQRQTEAANEHLELAAFRDDSDPNLGRRTRLLLTTVFGFVWTTVPIFQHISGTGVWRDSYLRMILSTFVLWGLGVAAWFWARESMTRTTLNKRVALAVMTVFPSQIILFFGASRIGLSFLHAEVLMIFIWAVVALTATLTVDRSFWPTTFGYISAFIFATQFPSLRYAAMAAANFIFTLNGIVLWFTPDVAPRLQRILRLVRLSPKG